MSTTTALMRSRAGAMTQFAETFAGGFTATVAYLSKRAESRRVYRELSGMTDRDLADIGISRSDLPRIAGLPSLAARQ